MFVFLVLFIVLVNTPFLCDRDHCTFEMDFIVGGRANVGKYMIRNSS